MNIQINRMAIHQGMDGFFDCGKPTDNLRTYSDAVNSGDLETLQPAFGNDGSGMKHSVIKNYANFKNLQIHYRCAGRVDPEKNPVLFLHMMPQSGRYFEPVLNQLSKSRMLVVPDYPGYGESDPPPENKPVTIEDYARYMWDLVDYLDLGLVDVVGHHTGSKVGIEMCVQHPRRVGKLMLISLAGLNVSDPKTTVSRSMGFCPRTDGSGLSDWWKTLKSYYASDLDQVYLQDIFSESVRYMPGFRMGFTAASEYSSKLRTVLSRLDHFVTIVNPGDDLSSETPLATTYLKRHEIIEKPDWKHGFTYTHTDECCALIHNWLESETTHSDFITG